MGIKNKLGLLFSKPEKIGSRYRLILERYFKNKKTACTKPVLHTNYILLQTFTTLVILFCTIYFYQSLSKSTICFLSLFVLLNVINTGAILEQQQWVFNLELGRGLLLLIWLQSTYNYYWLFLALILIITFVLLYYKTLKKYYAQLVFVCYR
jgi:alkylglycerol monooxygenase